MARRWIKLWVHELLTGTVRFDFTPAERGVWCDFLVLAGNCRLDGVIAAGSGKPYPHSWIAGTLNIPLELLEATLEKCKESARVKENSNGIHILNWTRYQSEYERQKRYRQAKTDTEKGGKISDPISSDELEIVNIISQLPGWKLSKTHDLEWLRDFKKEFLSLNIEHIKACRDYHSHKPTQHKGQWKTRLRQWMKHEQVPPQPKGEGYGGKQKWKPYKPPGESKPVKYIDAETGEIEEKG